MDQRPAEILIIDDEGPLLKLMTVYLRRLGFTVTAANTLSKAWGHVKRRPGQFAVMVLDAGMAESGIDELVLQFLALQPHLQVVVNSGYPVDMRGLQGAAPGQVEFLHKPFSPEMLATAMRRILGPEEKDV